MNYVFAVVSALAFDAVALVLIVLGAFYYAKLKFDRRQTMALAAVNRALSMLTINEIERVIAASPDKVVGLLRAGTAKANKAKANEAAVKAEHRV